MFTVSGLICLVILVMIILSTIMVSVYLCKDGEILEGILICPLVMGFFGTIFMVTTMIVVGGLGDGVFPKYVNGEQIGYITKISKQGIIWKTYEGEAHVGSGTQTAIDKPWSFSITNDKEDIFNKAIELQGRRVRIKYYKWLQMPFRMGISDVEVQSIELFE